MTAPTIPTTAAELEEMLGDTNKMKDLYGDKKAFGEFISNYAKTVMDKDQSIAQQVRDETQVVLRDWLKGHGQDTPVNLTPGDPVSSTLQTGRVNKIYNASAPGAQLDRDFSGSVEFFQSIWHHSNTLNNADSLAEKATRAKKVQNSFGSTVPADGGFLIPENLRSELLSVALETAIVRPRARVIPMDSLRVPIPSVDDTSHASSVYGGIVAYWTEEGASLTESQASFGRIVLEAKKLTAYCEIPNELVADAPAFGAFLDGILPEAMAYYEDVAFISGSGVGEPLGWANGSAAVLTGNNGGKTARATAGTVTWGDLAVMYARMLPASLGRAVWMISPDVLPALLQMQLASGAPIAIWLTGNQGFDAPTLSLLGRPVIVTEKVPPLGTPGDVNFVDLGYYLLGDRQVMQAMSSPHFKFASDKTAYRIIERVDGRPWLNSAITPKNGGPALTPIVKLG